MNCETYHIPVLLEQTIEGLNIRPNGVYVDLTFGGGGHSREIMKQLGKEGRLFGFDQDMDAMAGALQDERFCFVRSNFRFLKNWMMYYGIEQVDGILADLGVSSHHLDAAERGFSFRYNAPLDMRMNQRANLTAAIILQEYSEEQLANIFFLYGELKNSRRMAAAIVKKRKEKNIETTGELIETLKSTLPYGQEKKELAKAFQALRIEVNKEMTALQEMLQAATEILCPGGRLAVLTYHSLEDRMVKNMIRCGNIEGIQKIDPIFGRPPSPLKSIGKGVTTASEEEITTNPRSRSAKLRIAEKTEK